MPHSKAICSEAKVPFRWVKATVTYKHFSQLVAAIPLALELRAQNRVARIYFARYTDKTVRLEFQMYSDRTLATLRKAITTFKLGKNKCTGVKFESCEGSNAHALAFETVVALIGADKLNFNMLADVMHWFYNMAGMSYLQEATVTANHASVMLRCIPGWQNTPIFAPFATFEAEPKAPSKSKP